MINSLKVFIGYSRIYRGNRFAHLHASFTYADIGRERRPAFGLPVIYVAENKWKREKGKFEARKKKGF